MQKKYEEIYLYQYNIEQKLFTYSFYIGKSRHDTGISIKSAANIQASEDDRDQINDHLNTGIAEITNLFNCYFSTCNQSTHNDEIHKDCKIYIFMFSIPQFFPRHLITELQKTMENYVVMRVLNLWIMQHKPDEAVLSAAETDKLNKQLREIMIQRVKPHKPPKSVKRQIEM